jgi:uncharacterized RDD family membrane protein YckC
MAPVSNPPPPPGAVSPQWQPPPRHPSAPAVAPNGQPLASFSDRFIAYLIDQAIYLGISLLWVVPFMIWWISEIVSLSEQSSEPDPSAILALYVPVLLFTVVSMVLAAVFTYAYWVELQKRWGGQTVGKRVAKIRVIPADPAAEALGRGGYAVRWAIQFMVGSLVPLFSLVDGLWQLWDKPLQQCLHDMAAKTVVVKVG